MLVIVFHLEMLWWSEVVEGGRLTKRRKKKGTQCYKCKERGRVRRDCLELK
jgi:hypothetical protein